MSLRNLTSGLILTCVALFSGATPPKYDFRGAWIQTIFQGYEKRSTAQNKKYLTDLLDTLEDAGINAVIFQVRPRADAFYQSEIEPWSAYLTGEYGKAPAPAWDPLQFMIDECHSRGMELHAWLNPYRAPALTDKVPSTHLLRKHPERFVKYGKSYYFDPSLQANRDHICNVIADILTRYDVDGIHFDDYFYPYPIAKVPFPDSKAYAASGKKLSLGDWRRRNVDLLIEQVNQTIQSIKPWVRFGISPFGIWRNESSDPKGSKTRGLQNYDDLYADVPMWAELGLIDYQIPQIYWPIVHRSAPYDVLCEWWARNGRGRHIYIGQDIEKTLFANELQQKLKLIEPHFGENIHGNCWWYAATLKDIAPGLKAGPYAAPALVPEYLWKQVEPTSRPSVTANSATLTWKPEKAARRWVVYRFDSVKSVDIENPSAIEKVTFSPSFRTKRPGVYVITAVDYSNCESAPSKPVEIR